jgi:hypothetical protein
MALQELVRDAHVYLTQGLGTDFAPLGRGRRPTDWARGGDAAPYGIPFATHERLELVIPAAQRENFLVDVYAAHGPRESAERFADLVAVHWYQNALILMVEQVQADLGLDFALRLNAAGLGPDSDGPSMLAAAEKAYPGFEEWAASLRG